MGTRMAISDANPERRNLILTSLAFIIFYAADGKLSDGTVRLILVNISFSKPYILAYLTWALLFWFCLRFWQKSGFKFWSSLTGEIISEKIPASLATYAINKAKSRILDDKKIDSTKNIEASFFNHKYFFINIVCDFKNSSNATVHQEQVLIGGVKGVIFTINKIIIHSFKDNAFSEELIPYLLFCFSVSAPLWSKAL